MVVGYARSRLNRPCPNPEVDCPKSIQTIPIYSSLGVSGDRDRRSCPPLKIALTAKPSQRPTTSWIGSLRVHFGSMTIESPIWSRTLTRHRKVLLPPVCLGSHAEPRAFAHPSVGTGPTANALVEGIDGQRRKPDLEPNRATVLPRRIIRSLPTRSPCIRTDYSLHRAKSHISRLGFLRTKLAMVQRRMERESNSPTQKDGCLTWRLRGAGNMCEVSERRLTRIATVRYGNCPDSYGKDSYGKIPTEKIRTAK
jgi:hypothetical protein